MFLSNRVRRVAAGECGWVATVGLSAVASADAAPVTPPPTTYAGVPEDVHAKESAAVTTDGPGGDGVLSELLAGDGVTAVLQPVVELATGSVVGFEALARGPAGHALQNPDALFVAARAEGLLTELDAACVTAALTSAGREGVSAPWTVFVNVEPDSRIGEVLPDRAPRNVRVVVELTERALLADPAAVLGTMTSPEVV